MMQISHSKGLASSTKPAEKPSTGFLLRSAKRVVGNERLVSVCADALTGCKARLGVLGSPCVCRQTCWRSTSMTTAARADCNGAGRLRSAHSLVPS